MSDGTIAVSERSGLTDLSTLLGAHRGDDLDVDQRIALAALDQERTLLARYEECRQFLLDEKATWDDLTTSYHALKEFRHQLMLNAVLTSNAMQYHPLANYPIGDPRRIEDDYKRLCLPLRSGGYDHSETTMHAIAMVQSTDAEWAPLEETYTKESRTRTAIAGLLGPIEIALRHNRAVLEAACSRASGLLPDLEELTFPERPPL